MRAEELNVYEAAADYQSEVGQRWELTVACGGLILVAAYFIHASSTDLYATSSMGMLVVWALIHGAAIWTNQVIAQERLLHTVSIVAVPISGVLLGSELRTPVVDAGRVIIALISPFGIILGWFMTVDHRRKLRSAIQRSTPAVMAYFEQLRAELHQRQTPHSDVWLDFRDSHGYRSTIKLEPTMAVMVGWHGTSWLLFDRAELAVIRDEKSSRAGQIGIILEMVGYTFEGTLSSADFVTVMTWSEQSARPALA